MRNICIVVFSVQKVFIFMNMYSSGQKKGLVPSSLNNCAFRFFKRSFDTKPMKQVLIKYTHTLFIQCCCVFILNDDASLCAEE